MHDAYVVIAATVLLDELSDNTNVPQDALGKNMRVLTWQTCSFREIVFE
jgi:hypothetical protein